MSARGGKIPRHIEREGTAYTWCGRQKNEVAFSSKDMFPTAMTSRPTCKQCLTAARNFIEEYKEP